MVRSVPWYLPPNYYKSQMYDSVLINHFSTVADQSPIPVLIYNVPPFTGVDMTVNSVTELADHPNIIGMKDSTANLPKLLSLIKACSSKLSILSGGIFGDHCSPISDTTIISSMASASDHIDHVRTQLPYALIAGAISVLIFLIVGLTS